MASFAWSRIVLCLLSACEYHVKIKGCLKKKGCFIFLAIYVDGCACSSIGWWAFLFSINVVYQKWVLYAQMSCFFIVTPECLFLRKKFRLLHNWIFCAKPSAISSLVWMLVVLPLGNGQCWWLHYGRVGFCFQSSGWSKTLLLSSPSFFSHILWWWLFFQKISHPGLE